MPVNAVDPFDHNLVRFGEDTKHFTGSPCLWRPGVVAGNDFNHIAFFNVHGELDSFVCGARGSNYLGGQTDDSGETALAQLTRHSAEDARATWILLGID